MSLSISQPIHPFRGRLIDLTRTLRDGQRGVSFESAMTIERDGWNARTLHLYSHAGTHMDAPTHFFPAEEQVCGRAAGEQTIELLPLADCFSPAWVVDLPNLAPRAKIHTSHLGKLAGEFTPGESLLFRTGWSEYFDQPAIYRDGLPRISTDLAEWMVEQRVRMLGVEPPSVADVNDIEEVTHIHRILLGGGVTIVEGLANLQEISSRRVIFAALPLKIEHGDGCPCRAFAIENESAPDTEGPA